MTEPQYILVNGAMQLNPKWQAQQQQIKQQKNQGPLDWNNMKDSEGLVQNTETGAWYIPEVDPEVAPVAPKGLSPGIGDLETPLPQIDGVKGEVANRVALSQETANLTDSPVDNSFLQTKKIDAPDTFKAKSIGAVAGGIGEMAELAAGESVGSQTTSGVMSGMASGAAIGSAFPGPGTAIGAAVGAVLGGFMGAKKAKKAEAARAKAEKERKEKEQRMRTERAYTAKMSADQAAYANLQQGIANALSKSNVKIRV